ncbi:hypothetical protein L6164_011217 [Bauhinia variegata]|uniref:Uncharacterized protein n=1 Tax=Bauhinia variegata TaxID=167791 RepID=A0ACB9P5E1_BAUVA|nr:hypothetical protein L6164_011217 [Bauhinia variegata]
MEKNEGVDDQNSGWFEVEKKHFKILFADNSKRDSLLELLISYQHTSLAVLTSRPETEDEKHKVVTGKAHNNDRVSVLDQLSGISEMGLVSLPSLLTAVLLQAIDRSSSEQ